MRTKENAFGVAFLLFVTSAVSSSTIHPGSAGGDSVGGVRTLPPARKPHRPPTAAGVSSANNEAHTATYHNAQLPDFMAGSVDNEILEKLRERTSKNRNEPTRKKKNIIMILADDLGWDDVSFHGSSQIPTPNLDALASAGVIFNQHYAQPMCTPSRAALMTGLYPYHTGMQNYVIRTGEPWGLPLDLQILPQHLKKLGYSTHAVGKWHLGMFKKDYLPLQRGFDTFLGYMNGFIDYYNHKHISKGRGGIDFFDGNSPANFPGYATEVFTNRSLEIIGAQTEKSPPLFLYLAHLAPHRATEADPFQAPAETVKEFENYVHVNNRTKFAAMVAELDRSVGRIVRALQDKDLLKDTLIVFSSDNGGQNIGPLSNVASNWPLRGEKRTLFEGGTRVASFAWSADLEKPRRVENGLIHLVDWLPTFVRYAGGDLSTLGKLDGVDQWDMITRGSPSNRREIVYNINYVDQSAAIRNDRYKLIIGPYNASTTLNGWFPTLGYGGPMGYFRLEKMMDESVVAKTLREASLWWKNEVPQSEQDPFGNDPTKPRSWYYSNWAWREEAHLTCGKASGHNHCNPAHTVCLFDLQKDPCELNNIYEDNIYVAIELVERIRELSHSQHPVNNLPSDPEGIPKNSSSFFRPWK